MMRGATYLFFLLVGVGVLYAHDSEEQRKLMLKLNSIASGGSMTSSSTEVDDKLLNKLKFRRDQAGQEWQYEGLPIDYTVKRAGPANDTHHTATLAPTEETTFTTEATSKVYPPMSRRSRRVYNPDEACSVSDYPFIAALLVNKELWCGAVIISRDRVLTAAHCLQLQYNNRFYREYMKMLSVRVGSSNATSGGELLRVTEVTFHPNYKPDTLAWNFALLKLHKELSLGEGLPEAIAYSRDKAPPADNNIQFLGWGAVIGLGKGGQSLLQRVELPVYDLADCQDIYGRDLVTRTNFCAGYIASAKNVCNHDAGGPAIMDGVLTGILSFSSKRCDQPDQPAVFSSVGPVADWLDTRGNDNKMMLLRETALKVDART